MYSLSFHLKIFRVETFFKCMGSEFQDMWWIDGKGIDDGLEAGYYDFW